MKKFIKNIIVFTLFPICFFGGNVIVNKAIIKNEEVNLNANILIMGDSHPQQSLIPRIFYNAKSVTQPAEPYVLTYWKLKRILRNSSIDTLFLGFTHHNLSAYNDLKFSEDPWKNEMFKRSYPIQDFEHINKLIKIDKKEYYKTLIMETGFYPKKNHLKYENTYNKNYNSDVTDWPKAIERHFFKDGELLSQSNISYHYLDSILIHCKKNKIKPVLIAAPVHKKYYQEIPKKFKEDFNRQKQLLREKNILVIDKTRESYNDSLFLNSDHLNSYGANKLSKEITAILKVSQDHPSRKDKSY